MHKITVLVVDDSYVFRKLLMECLNEDPYIEVVAGAKDAFEARDAILKYRPDVMTLDVEMPRMDGIEFLRKLLPQYPIPVVMVSVLNNRVFDAMNLGAVDFVNKPVNLEGDNTRNFLKQELITKIKIASTVKAGKLKKFGEGMKPNLAQKAQGKCDVIAIGASTGGTEAIKDVIQQFKKDIPGVVIVQHMPVGFTAMYAERLNNQCDVFVKEAQNGDVLTQGQVLLAPGDKHMSLVKRGAIYQVECKAGEKVSGHCPSVDVLFRSVAQAAGGKAIGVILTGMGRDGADGLLEMRKSNATTIGQNEDSCIVYGMPKAAYDIGAVDCQLPLSDIAGKIYHMLGR